MQADPQVQRSTKSSPTPGQPAESRDRSRQAIVTSGFEAQTAALSPEHAPGYDRQRAGLSVLQSGERPAEALAASAFEGGGGRLPHHEVIQQAFGRHSIEGVSYHDGPKAAAANAQLGSTAFAAGNHVAAAGPLDLHTASHEAAHVIQQAGGVHLKAGIGAADDAYEKHADAVADAVVQGRSAESLLDNAPSGGGGGGQSAVQLKGGLATEPFSQGKFSLKPGETIEYDQVGRSFGTKLTITHRNGVKLDTPILVEAGIALTLLGTLEDAEGLAVVETDHAPRRTGRELQQEMLERNATSGEGNPDTAGGTTNSNFSTPIATSLEPDGSLRVTFQLHTANVWDRVSWKCRVGTGDLLCAEDKSWWSNPAWDPSAMNRYSFREGYGGADSDGRGEGGVRRQLNAVVPAADMKRVFGEGLEDLNDAGIICFGMEVFYGGGGPTAATRGEFSAAYDASVATAHQYGLGATSSPESYGYVDLSGLGLKGGDWLTEEEIWAQDLAENPSPNIKLALPPGYGEGGPAAAMAPEGGMKLATRIENEATLAVSSLAQLKNIVGLLTAMGSDPGRVAEMMAGDETLDQFEWSVTAVEDNSMVFTDVYLDDPAFTALRAGVGIRKRSSETATKLNVKTGPGYQVGELDGPSHESDTPSAIYRRHEIGYDLSPDAEIEDIGGFLASGVEHYDAWNRGGEQANLAVPGEHGIDFSKLRGTMVLQGDRKKFNLRAVNKMSGGAINIEISCDHTVGRTFEDYESARTPEDLFTNASGAYKQVFNVEMELEHLGAGAPAEEASGSSVPQPSSSTGTGPSPKLERSAEVDTRRAPPGHPGRLYMREDAANPKFNTPSYEVFYKSHSRMIDALQAGLRSRGELQEDKQKLENLFGELFEAPGEVGYGPAPRRKAPSRGTAPRPGRGLKERHGGKGKGEERRTHSASAEVASTVTIQLPLSEHPAMGSTYHHDGRDYEVVGVATSGDVTLRLL